MNHTRQRALVGIASVSALGTVLSRATGLGRTVFQAAALGANGVSDAYNLANTIPNQIYDLILGGVLAGTLVPVFVKALADDEERGWEAISAVSTAIAVVLGAVSAVFLVAVPWIIRLYPLSSSSAERHLAVSLLYLFVPQVALLGLVAVATAVLAARRSYAAPMYAPVLNNLAVIGVLLVFSGMVAKPTVAAVRSNHDSVWLLGLGTTAGVLVFALALVPALRSAGARIRWVWNPSHPACRAILRLSGWTAGFVVANQFALVIVLGVASRNNGDLTAYLYAYQFFLLPHAIWTVSLLGPMETEVAHRWQAGDRDGARRHLIETIWSGMVLIVPASLGYAVLARPTIDLVLLHGNMSPHGARVTADALTAFALGLPGFSLYAVLMRAYQAMQDTRSMFVVYLLENAVNVGVAVVLYPRFHVTGLAAAWGIAYGLGAAIALWHVARRMGGVNGRRLASAAGSVVIAAAPAALVAWGVSTLLAHLPGGTRQAGVALRLLLAVVAAVCVYLYAARNIGFESIRRRVGAGRRRPVRTPPSRRTASRGNRLSS